ncbi:MAG: GntR family transcriptional regulator [Acidimicrobiales bacterium]
MINPSRSTEMPSLRAFGADSLHSASVRGERTADAVARRIAQSILDGELMPGTRLTEEALAARYEVSRTPIREALIALSTNGLVELTRNRGATVLQLTAADVTDVYQLRALLESEAARLAAPKVTAELADLLDKSCDRLAELHGAPASEQLAADTFFHYTIAAASGSARLQALIRQVSAVPEAYRSFIAYTGDDMSEAERQHRAIAAALRRHRSAQARSLMRAHVSWAGRLALLRLEGRLAPS